MAARRWLSVLLLVLALAAGAGWWLQRQVAAELRVEIGLARDEQRELARLQAENRRLRDAAPPAEMLDKLRADHAAIAGLRADVEQARRNVEARERALAAAPERASPAVPAAAKPFVPLTNAGRATPAAATATALWSAGQRDIDALAAMLTFDPETRRDAERILAALPAEKRAEYGTPERLVAQSMTTIPLPVAIRVVDEKAAGADRMDLSVEMQSASGAGGRPVPLSVERSAGGWRLIVPRGAIRDLGNKLRAENPPSN